MATTIPSKLYQAAQPLLETSSSLGLRQLVTIFRGLLAIPDLRDGNLLEVTSQAPTHQLLVLQYQCESYEGPEDKLLKVIFPFLQRQESTDRELVEAALDATFIGINTLADPSEELQRDILGSNIHLSILSRILIRIFERTTEKEVVSDMVAALVQRRLETVMHDTAFQLVQGMLRPLVNDVLPILQESPLHLQAIYEDLSANTMQRRDVNALMVSTTILCCIIPYMERSKLLPDKELWRLIEACLQRGLSITQAQETDVLLRRRGLYILRSLAGDELKDWKKYAACFETIEMECEPHLIDQVWPTVADLCSSSLTQDTSENTPPAISWHWMSLLLQRSILSPEVPAVRKLALYRLFTGQVGIVITHNSSSTLVGNHSAKMKNTKGPVGIPLSCVPPSFVVETVLVAFDTLEPSVGTSMHLEEDGKIVRYDLNDMFADFLKAYIVSIAEEDLHVFLENILSDKLIRHLRHKSVVELHNYVAAAITGVPDKSILVSGDCLKEVVGTFQEMFSVDGGITRKYKESLLMNLAAILQRTKMSSSISPDLLLSILGIFEFPETEELQGEGVTGRSWIENNETYRHLTAWLQGFEGSRSDWAAHTGSTLATAFIDGMFSQRGESNWTPQLGISQHDRRMAKSIVLLCTLAVHSKNSSLTPSALLWPAIHKGLSNSAHFILSGNDWAKADRADRAIAVLEAGCTLRVLSGLGNGDLVIDKNSAQMMPPPASIENMLSNVVNFLLAVIKDLTSKNTDDRTITRGGRSGEARQLSVAFGRAISQIQLFRQCYPSSLALSNSMDSFTQNGMLAVSETSSTEGFAVIEDLCLLFAAVACGSEVKHDGLVEVCNKLLLLQFEDRKARKTGMQSERSIFQYAKWGVLSYLVPILRTSSSESIDTFVKNLSTHARRAIEAIPSTAFVPLFTCIIEAATYRVDSANASEVDPKELEKVSKTIFALLGEMTKSKEYLGILDDLSSFFFSPRLILEEANRTKEKSGALTPIRNAFLDIKKIAGTKKPYVLQIALGRLCAAWLHGEPSGFTAVPYRDIIIDLILYKEELITDANLKQTALSNASKEGHIGTPPQTDSQSIIRAMIMVYFSKLPDKLSDFVHRDLVKYIILEILKKIRPKKGETLAMKGTSQYCASIRGFQALCVLSRFIDSELAPKICGELFPCLAENLHGQVRFFVEIFTLQCLRRHPVVFGDRLFSELRKPELGLQYVSSLMILAGNVLVGRYEKDFLELYTKQSHFSLSDVLASTLPWLSSTQSFTRAIAQLLCHKLLPLCIDTSDPEIEQGPNRFPYRMFLFLNTNSEMKRLRQKQTKFFEEYDADSICTPEGVLQIALDDSREANPDCLIDVIKSALQTTFKETDIHDSPMWRQIETMLEDPGEETVNDSDDDITFQRKIIPMDALNLALEAAGEKRQRNSAGRRKQNLIVCASLVDKVPNLGGLTRTSEIFAAQKLVIPDLRVTKMDNFQSLSVGAGEWIDIEECKEKDLIDWLRRHRDAGWYVVGIEQTSSSQSLVSFEFPDLPIILLLGKEKEGIPVELLSLVDVAIEIPQLGLIRSLNVHVSGALTIWELTRQRLEKGLLKD